MFSCRPNSTACDFLSTLEIALRSAWTGQVLKVHRIVTIADGMRSTLLIFILNTVYLCGVTLRTNISITDPWAEIGLGFLVTSYLKKIPHLSGISLCY